MCNPPNAMCNAPEHKHLPEADRERLCKAEGKRLRKQAARLAAVKSTQEAVDARTR